jgi:hypothetical protein
VLQLQHRTTPFTALIEQPTYRVIEFASVPDLTVCLIGISAPSSMRACRCNSGAA